MYTIDKLNKSDYYRGYLDVLEQLTDVEKDKINYKDFCKRYDEMNNRNINVYVIRSEKKIIGTASLIIEPKFIHNLGSVAHIEDVVIDINYRGNGLGKKIIDHIVNIARERNCYKIILDCSSNNVGFYKKCGFNDKNIGMSLYF